MLLLYNENLAALATGTCLRVGVTGAELNVALTASRLGTTTEWWAWSATTSRGMSCWLGWLAAAWGLASFAAPFRARGSSSAKLEHQSVHACTIGVTCLRGAR
jgi:hypothetical protein